MHRETAPPPLRLVRSNHGRQEQVGASGTRGGQLCSARAACKVFVQATATRGGSLVPMATEQLSAADIFRRAQAIRSERPHSSYREIRDQLVREFTGKPFPTLYNLTIPEQDARAPQEDWSAGLPLVRRGIQFQDWKEIADGVLLSLEQTENYERERGPEGDRDKWHDRSVGIDEPTKKGVGKWMPEELMKLAERQTKK